MKNILVKAVGFDLGDTLVYYKGTPLNWMTLYEPALLSMSTKIQFSPSPEQIQAAKDILACYNTRLNPRTTEVSSDEIISRILYRWGFSPADCLITATDAFFNFFQRDLCIYDDTLEVLQRLKGLNISVGILTDAPYGMQHRQVLRDLSAAADLSSFVDTLITSVDVGHRKPHPAGFLKLADKLNVSAENMVYVGNEEKDIAGATSAGVPAILISRDNTNNQWGQIASVTKLIDILDVIDQEVR